MKFFLVASSLLNPTIIVCPKPGNHIIVHPVKLSLLNSKLPHYSLACSMSVKPTCCISHGQIFHSRLVWHSHHSCRAESTVASVTEVSVLSMALGAMKPAACMHLV